MSWRGEVGGIEVVKQGYDVVMMFIIYCYFDYYQFNYLDEFLAIGGYLFLDKVYNYYLVLEELSEEEVKYIFGVQGNVWIEYIFMFFKLQYMAYFRMQVLFEVVWMGKKKLGYSNFVKCFSYYFKWMEKEGINVVNYIYDVDLKVVGGQGVFFRILVSNVVEEGWFVVIKVLVIGNVDFFYMEFFELEFGMYIV